MKIIQVKVKPNARSSQLTPPESGDIWQAQLKSPPVDGKANAELISLVADYFHCRKSDVEIKTGASSRIKRVQISES